MKTVTIVVVGVVVMHVLISGWFKSVLLFYNSDLHLGYCYDYCRRQRETIV